MKASEIDSLDSYRASGPGALSAKPVEQVIWVGLEPEHLAEPGRLRRVSPAGGAVTGGRRRADRSASRHRLVATRYSQVRTEARPSNPARPCQADSKVSCSASSASATEPRIR